MCSGSGVSILLVETLLLPSENTKLLQDLRQQLEGLLKLSCSSIKKRYREVKTDANKQGRESTLLHLVPILSKTSTTESVKLAFFY